MQLSELKDFATELGREAGERALNYKRQLSAVKVEFKSERDLVTEADRAIEDFLVSRIRAAFPTHAITGEESGEWSGEGYRWILDPIDGTASFVHDQPFFSISIAVEKGGELVAGCVSAPALGEIYSAALGEGAWCNGKRLQVSTRAELNQCMLATGFACIRAGLSHNNLPYLQALLPQLRDLRRYGSAAIDLCYVAAGRIDGFWELNLHDYDVAAGLLILKEAGGMHTDFDGRHEQLYHRLVATNGQVHDKILTVFRKLRKELPDPGDSS